MFGIEKKALHLGSNRTYTFWFWLSDVKNPWLGADFLEKFNREINRDRCLLIEKRRTTSQHRRKIFEEKPRQERDEHSEQVRGVPFPLRNQL